MRFASHGPRTESVQQPCAQVARNKKKLPCTLLQRGSARFKGNHAETPRRSVARYDTQLCLRNQSGCCPPNAPDRALKRQREMRPWGLRLQLTPSTAKCEGLHVGGHVPAAATVLHRQLQLNSDADRPDPVESGRRHGARRSSTSRQADAPMPAAVHVSRGTLEGQNGRVQSAPCGLMLTILGAPSVLAFKAEAGDETVHVVGRGVRERREGDFGMLLVGACGTGGARRG